MSIVKDNKCFVNVVSTAYKELEANFKAQLYSKNNPGTQVLVMKDNCWIEIDNNENNDKNNNKNNKKLDNTEYERIENKLKKYENMSLNILENKLDKMMDNIAKKPNHNNNQLVVEI